MAGHFDRALGIFLAVLTTLVSVTALSPFWLAIAFDPFGPMSGSSLLIITIVLGWLWGPPLLRLKLGGLNGEGDSSTRWRLYWQTQVGVYAVSLALFLLLFTICTAMSSVYGPGYG